MGKDATVNERSQQYFGSQKGKNVLRLKPKPEKQQPSRGKLI